MACIYNCDLIYHFTPGENAVGRHHLAISWIVPTVLVYHFPHFSTFLAGQYLQIDRADGRSISSNSPETNARRRQFPFNTTMCASWNAIAYAVCTRYRQRRHSSGKTRIYSCKFAIKPRRITGKYRATWYSITVDVNVIHSCILDKMISGTTRENLHVAYLHIRSFPLKSIYLTNINIKESQIGRGQCCARYFIFST